MCDIVTPERFLRRARKFCRRHPDLGARFAAVLGALREDPFQPRLELHPLAGKLEGCHSVGLTHSYRIALTLLVTETEIILLDIGSHDQAYR